MDSEKWPEGVMPLNDAIGQAVKCVSRDHVAHGEEELMYRHRIHMTVRDLHGWNEALAVAEEINALATRLGQPNATMWTESFGAFNQIVAEIDYESLAAYETGQKEMSEDPEWSKLMGRLIPVLVEGKGYTEMMEQATSVGG